MADETKLNMDDQNQPDSYPNLIVTFKREDSVIFTYRRDNVNPFQLMALAQTLAQIARIEISEWHIEQMAKNRARQPGIVVPNPKM